MHSIPTLIIGGGTAGAALSCALAGRGAGAGVSIVDVDLFGTHGSNASSAGGVHCLFPDALDVRLALESVEFYRRRSASIGYREQGSLWLCDEDSLTRARAWLAVAGPLGIAADLPSISELRDRFPLLGDLSDIAGAVLTSPGGFLSPHKLRVHYLNRAQAGGVSLMDGWQVVAVAGEHAPFRVGLKRVAPRSVRKVLTGPLDSAADLVVEAGRVVNAAGPWSARVAALYGGTLPVRAGSRQIVMLRQPAVDLQSLPVCIDGPQNLAFRGGEFDRKPCVMAGGESADRDDRIDFSTRPYAEAMEGRLVRRIPALAGAELLRTWSSHDDASTDGRPVIGPVPGRDGLFNFNGLSVRQTSVAHALAEGLAGWMTAGRWQPDLPLDELTEWRFAPHAAPALGR